jgi:cytochrome P450
MTDPSTISRRAGSPVVGDLAMLEAMRRNPIEVWGPEAYRDMAVEGRFLGRAQILVNDPDAIGHILHGNRANYRRDVASRRMLRPVLGDGLLTAEGENWRQQRRAIAPAMAPRALTLLARHVAEEAETAERLLRDGLGTAVELLPAMQALALDIAGRSMFSLEMGQHLAEFREVLHEYQSGLSHPVAADFLLPEDAPSRIETRRTAFRERWVRLVDAMIAERFAAGREPGVARDLLDLLADARDPDTGEALDAATLRDDVATMILAGHETTAVTLFWSCLLLAEHPGWQEELAAEVAPLDLSPSGAAEAIASMPALRRHVDEALRLYPPVFAIVREAIGDDAVAGLDIPAGALITIAPYVMHRHERFWRDPARFDPARWAAGEAPSRYTYLPFGAGPRVCIGATFALTEAVVVLGRMLQRFRLALVAGDEAVRPRGAVTTHPDRPVRFVVTAR